MNPNAIPALVGCGLMTAGGCAAGGLVGYSIVAPGAPIYGKALGSVIGAGVGGLAGSYGGASLGAAILRHGERRAMRRMAHMPMPIATSTPTPVQPRGRSRSVVIPAQPTRPPSPPPPPPHLAAARVYNQRAMPSTRGFQPMVVRTRGARV
jgi:hypothetical protein